MNPKLELNIDSTSLGSSGCSLKFVRTVVGNPEKPDEGAYRQKVNGVKLNYGIALHKFIDTMYKTGGHYPTAKKEAGDWFTGTPHTPDRQKPYLSDLKHLLTTCYMVWTDFIETDLNFELLVMPGKCVHCKGQGVVIGGELCTQCRDGIQDKQPATEVTFSIPFYEDQHLLVNLCGTIDQVGKFVRGCYNINDWKSTSSKSDKPEDRRSYFTTYDMSRQLRLYTLACRMMGKLHPNSILGQVGNSVMSATITAIFLKSNANETIVERSSIYQYDAKELTDFENMLRAFCYNLSTQIANKHFPKEGILNGTCEGKWAKCIFWHACKSPEHVAEMLLNRDLARWKYNPLAFND